MKLSFRLSALSAVLLLAPLAQQPAPRPRTLWTMTRARTIRTWTSTSASRNPIWSTWPWSSLPSCTSRPTATKWFRA